MLLSLVKTERIWEAGLTSRKDLSNSIYIANPSLYIISVPLALFCKVWLCTTSLMHARGHTLQALP